MRLLSQSMLTRFLAVGAPFYRSEARWRILGRLGILFVLLIAINGMNVVNSYVGRDFMSALAERHASQFYFLALVLAGVFCISTVIEVFARYAEQSLGLVWREWLTRYFLERYLGARAYLRLSNRQDIDNPDERISQDVKTFTDMTLSILVLSFNGIVTVLAFSGVLWLISPWLFLAALGYALAGSLGTIFLGRRLIGLNNQQLQREADFRFGLGRLREHAETIAQMSGEEEQKNLLTGRLRRVIDNFRQVIRVSRNLGFFVISYKYMPQIIPIVLVARPYIQGNVEFGAVTQAAMAFSQVQGAFSLIVNQYQDLFTFAAIIGRLGSFLESIQPELADKALAGPLPRTPMVPLEATIHAPRAPLVETLPDTHRVAYEHLTCWTPEDEQRPLVRDLSLELREGQRLAITGARSASKTAMWACAGLWMDGRGRVRRPGRGQVMFVPQEPCASAGTMREILLRGLGREVPEERLRSVLGEVGLQEVVDRQGGLDVERDWASVLSRDELQAATFARLLLASPLFAFLDNPAQGVDAEVAERLYHALAHSSISYVTGGCPSELLRYHDLQLDLQEDGHWQLARVTAQVAGK
jgi:putative ATP-binding cassette transporter